jgi:WD40 repeat protein
MRIGGEETAMPITKKLHFPLCYLFILFMFLLVGCKSTSTKREDTPSFTQTVMPHTQPQVIDLGEFGKGLAYDIVWSPDGELLAVRSSSGIYLHNTLTWDVVQAIPDRELKGRSLQYFTFSPDGKELVFVTNSMFSPGALWRYEFQRKEFTPWVEDSSLDFQSAPVFSPDKGSFAILNEVCEIIGEDKKKCIEVLELRSSADGNLLYALQESDSWQDNAIVTFTFSPDGQQIAVASKDNFVRVWNTMDGQLLFEFQHDSNAVDISYSPDGSVLASASRDATVRFWDTRTGKTLFVLRDFKQGIQRVVYLDHGKKLLVGQLYTNLFQEYAVNDHFLPEHPLSVEIPAGKNLSGHLGSDVINTVNTYISPDSHNMAVLLNDIVQIWDLESGKPILTLPEYNSLIFKSVISAESGLLAVADHDIHLWNVPSRKWLAMLPVHAHEIQDVQFSPNGRQLAVSADGNLTFWDTATFQKLYEKQTRYSIEVLAYSPDGKQIALAGGGFVRLLDAAKGVSQQQFKLLDDSYPLALTFSSDGKSLFYVGSIERLGWDLELGKTLYSFQTKPDYFGKAAIASNLEMVWQWDSQHRYFDAASNPQWNNSFHFFDPVTGQDLYDIAYPDDGQYIVAALGMNGRVMAWYRNGEICLLDAASGQTLVNLPFNNLGRLSISPDSNILVATDYSHPLHLWDISAISKLAEDTPPITATPTLNTAPTSTATATVSPISIQSLSTPTLGLNTIRPENVAHLEMLSELGLGRVDTALWAPDGKSLAVGGYPNVYIFKLDNSQPMISLPAKGEILKLVFSPDGHLLAGQISNLSIQVWDVATGKTLYILENFGCWNADMSFTSDDQVLSAQCGQSTYRWSTLTGQLLDKVEGTDQVYRGISSPDGSLLFQPGGDTAYLVDASNENILQSFEVSGMTPNIAAFSPDGKTLLVWFYEYEVARSGIYVPGKDHKSLIQLWNLTTGQPPTLRASLPTGKWYRWDAEFMMGGFQILSFTRDSQRLATASGDGKIQIWDIQSGKLLYTLSGGDQVYFSPDGNRLISIGNPVQIWDVFPGRQPEPILGIPGFTEFQLPIALTENGKKLVTAQPGEFQIWSINESGTIEKSSMVKLPDTDMILPTTSSDGKWIAYSTKSNLVLGENSRQGFHWETLEIFSDKPFPSSTEAVIFSPDSTKLAVIDADRKILLWKLDTPKAKPLELGHEIYVTNLLFSPDSALLLGAPGPSLEEQSLYLWEVSTGKLLRTWKVKGDQFAFHPNGTSLAVTDFEKNQISVLDLSTWAVVQTMEGDPSIREIIFSPDGRLLLTTSNTGIQIWGIAAGKILKTITGSYTSLMFSPDGKTLIAGLYDGRLQVWNIRNK